MSNNVKSSFVALQAKSIAIVFLAFEHIGWDLLIAPKRCTPIKSVHNVWGYFTQRYRTHLCHSQVQWLTNDMAWRRPSLYATNPRTVGWHCKHFCPILIIHKVLLAIALNLSIVYVPFLGTQGDGRGQALVDPNVISGGCDYICHFLPLDEAVASGAIFVSVSGSDGWTETLFGAS